MASYGKVYQVNPQFLLPFNDKPEYISGSTVVGENGKLLFSGIARYQSEGWYNIGVRSRPLSAHSFGFSVKCTPKTLLGAYSVGIVDTRKGNKVALPSINISHFLRSSGSLHRESLVANFFSGFGRNNYGKRTQIGEFAEPNPVGKTFDLTVKYDDKNQLLSCFVLDFPIHHIRAELENFHLEIRFEAVCAAGNFEIEFDDICYYAYDEQQPSNIQELTGELIESSGSHKKLSHGKQKELILPKKIQVPSSQESNTVAQVVDKDLPESISILFLAADPTNNARLRQSEELREIQEKLKLSKHRTRFELIQQMSTRPADISQAMLDTEPQIVHFSGHGASSGSLSFETITGLAHPVEPDALADLFKQFASEVICVVLNACYSELQASAIAQHVPYVIGMNQAITDKAAISFTIGFYQALGAGRSIEDAYKLGCTQIRLQGFPEHETPIFIRKTQ